ncbi:MAG: ATP-binding protein [Acidobacteria bacterium]|nr:ATP-binding protein [Acidobacteriota bacterium]
MHRRILIIDDHDDLASALDEVFTHTGHEVKVLTDRASALKETNIDGYDVVITDLDVRPGDIESSDEKECAPCLPDIKISTDAENIKAFKLCAANFRREGFTEEELKNLVATVLDYKIRFVDREEAVQGLHEKIEFELPSAISLMHIVLDYLLKRVEKLRVIDPERSNLFVALDEAFVNAVKHGNKYDADKVVRIECEISQKEARFTVEDEGEGFDVNAIPDPLDPENLFKTSGRGVLFIYNIMDEVAYNERGNRLTMVKKAADSDDV